MLVITELSEVLMFPYHTRNLTVKDARWAQE